MATSFHTRTMGKVKMGNAAFSLVNFHFCSEIILEPSAFKNHPLSRIRVEAQYIDDYCVEAK